MEIDGHEIAMGLRAAYLAMHRQTNASLVPGSVTADQFVLLITLAETDFATQRELATRTGSDPNTLRAMLLLLEQQGLVIRPPHPRDSRARSVMLTEQGRREITNLTTMSEPVRQRLQDALGPDDSKTLHRLLARVVTAMGNPPAPTSSSESD